MARSGLAPALAAIAGIGSLLGGAGAADAASFSVEQIVNTSQQVGFTAFDTGLGTLTSVDVGLTSTAPGHGSIFSITGGEGGDHGSTGFTSMLEILAPTGAVLFSGQYGATASCTVSVAGSCTSGLQAPVYGGIPPAFTPDPFQITNATDLAAFIGPGTVDLTAIIASFTPNTIVCSSRGVCSPSNDIGWSGDLTVTYNYTLAVSAVPEPASLALFGAGLAGLGWVRRRRAGMAGLPLSLAAGTAA